MLIIKVNKLFSFFSSRCFLREIENMYSVFLSSYRNIRESLGELAKAGETLTCSLCSHSISRFSELPLVSITHSLERNMQHVSYFLIIIIAITTCTTHVWHGLIEAGIVVNNYSPKWRWIVVDIHRAVKRRGKYTPLSPTLRWIIYITQGE